MGQFAALRTQKIEGFEELKEVVLGTRREIVQLERGKIKGEIAHAVIGDLPIDTASFNLGIRTKGGSHRDRIGIGLLAASSNHVVRSSYRVLVPATCWCCSPVASTRTGIMAALP